MYIYCRKRQPLLLLLINASIFLFIYVRRLNSFPLKAIHFKNNVQQIEQENSLNDVRMEIKIKEIKNKTGIVRCTKESRISKLLYVSTRLQGKNETLNTIQRRRAESDRPKVVGGKTAKPNEFPFQAHFLTPKILCGGTILNEEFILTAAHCFFNHGNKLITKKVNKSWTVVAGDHNWSKDDGREQRRQIRGLHIHKEYEPYVHVYDIAIVRLDRPLQLSNKVQPIILPHADYEATGDAVVTGWGTLQSGGSTSLVLQKVTVPIVDRAVCVKKYEEKQMFISVKMMCAGELGVSGVDSCQGDSGGPLSVKLRNGSSTLVGVVSGGIECGRAEYPGIYMQVSKYIDWINNTLTNYDVRDCRYPGMCASLNYVGNCHRCRGGFVKDAEDKTRCKYANKVASLIVSTNEEVQLISLKRQQTSQRIQNGSTVLGTDFNFQTSTIFWFSNTDKLIYQAPINLESQKQSIFNDPLSQIGGLAVDWIYHHLYWVDLKRREICEANFNGTIKKVIFNGGIEGLTSIAVNPLNKWMYWTDSAKKVLKEHEWTDHKETLCSSAQVFKSPKVLL